MWTYGEEWALASVKNNLHIRKNVRANFGALSEESNWLF